MDILRALLAAVLVAGSGSDAPAQGQAVERWLAGFGGGSAGEVRALDEGLVKRAIPSLRFFVVRFRSYPVAPAVPEGLATTNLVAVHPDGRVERIPDTAALETLFRAVSAPVRSRKLAEDAARTWLLLTQEFQQDGFFHFNPPEVTAFAAGPGGIRVSCRALVLPDAGDRGEIRATLAFDRAGRLVQASETSTVVAGRRSG